MGHDHERERRPCRAAGQVLGQPRDRLDVEVVGRLVQQQDVEVGQQRSSERDPAALPSGESGDRAVEVETDEQVADDLARLRIRRPLVLGALSDDDVADGRGLVEVVVLTDHAPVQPAVVSEPAVVGRLQAGQDAQQRRLAVTVATDDADPVAVLDPEAHVAQQRPDAVGLGDALGVDQVRRGVFALT